MKEGSEVARAVLGFIYKKGFSATADPKHAAGYWLIAVAIYLYREHIFTESRGLIILEGSHITIYLHRRRPTHTMSISPSSKYCAFPLVGYNS